MKRTLILGTLVCMLALVPAVSAEKPAELRVLFVGNSLTYYNDVPELVRELSRLDENSSRLEIEMLAAGGASVAQHLEAGYLPQYLSDGDFDIVVIQDISGWPICPPEFPGCADSVASIEEIVGLIRSKGAEPIWYSTYQRLPAIQAVRAKRHGKLLVVWISSLPTWAPRGPTTSLLRAKARHFSMMVTRIRLVPS